MAEQDSTMAGRGRRQERRGVVVSRSGDKTVRVEVTRRIRHPLYDKVIRQTSRCLAHDAENRAQVGDRVRLVQTRPLSKSKRWRIVEVRPA